MCSKCCVGHTYPKNYSLFISNLTGHPVFYLAALLHAYFN